jgi:hypothetical protein
MMLFFVLVILCLVNSQKALLPIYNYIHRDKEAATIMRTTNGP